MVNGPLSMLMERSPVEITGDERQTTAQSSMPIFPVVTTIAHTQLARDFVVTHHHVELLIDFQKIIIVADIQEPFHRT